MTTPITSPCRVKNWNVIDFIYQPSSYARIVETIERQEVLGRSFSRANLQKKRRTFPLTIIGATRTAANDPGIRLTLPPQLADCRRLHEHHPRIHARHADSGFARPPAAITSLDATPQQIRSRHSPSFPLFRLCIQGRCELLDTTRWVPGISSGEPNTCLEYRSATPLGCSSS